MLNTSLLPMIVKSICPIKHTEGHIGHANRDHPVNILLTY